MITIFKCAGSGDYDGLLQALDAGQDPNVGFDLDWIPSDLHCPNYCMSRYNKCLNAVNIGRYPHTEYVGGWRPLHIAVENGHYTCAQLLIDRGTDLKAVDDAGWHPLHTAMKHGHETCARLLLDHNVDLNLKHIKYGTTPLHMACYYQRISCIKLLLERGADPSIKNHVGETAGDLVDDLTHEIEIRTLLRQYMPTVTKRSKK
jgi:hypothetical protein